MGIGVVLLSGPHRKEISEYLGPRGTNNSFCSAYRRLHHFTILQMHAKTGLALRRLFRERGHHTACNSQRRAGDRPRKYREAWYPVNDTRLSGHRCN